MTKIMAFEKLNRKLIETDKLISDCTTLLTYLQKQIKQSKATKKRLQKLLTELDYSPTKQQ